MKKTGLVIAVMLVVFAMGAALQTERFGWSKPKAATTTDDTLVSANVATMKTANIPTGAYQPIEGQNALEICWVMGADAQSCAAYLYAARANGDIVLVWNGTLTAGKQVSTSGEYYVDTIASSTDNWIKTVSEIDKAGSDRMSRIVLDTCGYKYFFFQYTGLSSESIQAYYSGY